MSRQVLPKRLSTVDDVLKAWEDGDDKLPGMKRLVENRHPNPAIRLDRSERKQLADHQRVFNAVLRLGRASFIEQYEMGGGDKPRTLSDFRVVLEKEAKALKKNYNGFSENESGGVHECWRRRSRPRPKRPCAGSRLQPGDAFGRQAGDRRQPSPSWKARVLGDEPHRARRRGARGCGGNVRRPAAEGTPTPPTRRAPAAPPSSSRRLQAPPPARTGFPTPPRRPRRRCTQDGAPPLRQ